LNKKKKNVIFIIDYINLINPIIKNNLIFKQGVIHMKKFKILQEKQELILNKFIVGIDPSKKKHQAIIIDSFGLPVGTSFSFPSNYDGYNNVLWEKIKKEIPDYNTKSVVFAVETSCNLWQNLVHYLNSKGYTVLLVSPLVTYRSRPMLNNDFSRTDPKDALSIAKNCKQGYFNIHKELPSSVNNIHNLSITYDKLRKNLSQQKTRLLSLIERVFPEFLDHIAYDTDTALYLLKKYFLPQHYIKMNLRKEAENISKISNGHYKIELLQQIKLSAEKSIGIPQSDEDAFAIQLSINSWITLIENINSHMDLVIKKIISLAKQSPYFSILTSLKGISDITASLFIAEIKDFSLYKHYKQVEKLAGYNLRLSESGQFIGSRHISHIGNKRLRWILYKMAEEAVRYIPEIRVKFLKRQIMRKSYRKNIVACIPLLLRLLFSLVKDNRVYQENKAILKELKILEAKYLPIKNKRK
jgi:transposase